MPLSAKQRAYYDKTFDRSGTPTKAKKQVMAIYEEHPDMCKTDEEIDMLERVDQILADPGKRAEFLELCHKKKSGTEE